MKLHDIKDILSSISIILIPNIFMILLAYWTDTNRVAINVDYFIPLFLLAYRQRVLFVIAFVAISLVDFLVLFTQIFPFIRISDLFYLSKFAFISSSSYQVYGITLILLIAIQVYFYIKKYNIKYNKYLLILFNIIIFYYAYTVHFSNISNHRLLDFDTNFVGSQLTNNYNYTQKRFIRNYTVGGEVFDKKEVPNSTVDLFSHPNSHNKVLLVVNESWGVPENAQIQNDVLSPITNNSATNNLKQSTLEFVGATIAGELRELCAKEPLHFNLKHQIDGFEDCLPNQYKGLGYNTVAVHGAIGFMYDRQYWYPRAGFQQMMFRDKGLNISDSRCYSFPGNCDSDIAHRIVEQFDKNDKLFLYWLTLNTHAIYDKRDLRTDIFDCDKYNIKPNTAVCRNLKLQKQYFHTLSQVISNPSLSGTRVIVVGDHEPPLIEEKETVFISGKVPIFEFEVK